MLIDVKTIVGGADKEAVQDEIAQLQTNSDEVMHTGNTGAGKELIPTNVMGDTIFNLIPNYSALLPLLPGNHGTGMEISEVLPIVGEASMFEGNAEWTTGSSAITPGGQKLFTDSVSITQAQLKLEIAISKRELAYSVENLEALIRDRANRSAARTIDALLLNADTATSGNVNLDGGTPASTSYFMQADNGLRKLGLVNSTDIGAFDEDDFITMLDTLGDYAANPGDCLFVTNRLVYNKMLKFSNLKTYDKVAQNATVLTGVLANIYGVDVLVARDCPAKALATGKVSSTAGSNVTGTGVMFYKPAVQYGYGKVQDYEVTRVAGKGAIITVTMEFGFGVPAVPSTVSGKFVTTARNITL